MDGGGKFSTAVLFVALGAAGAVVFTRDEPPRDAAPAWSDSLVRRATPHYGPQLPRDPVESVPAIPTTPSFGGAGGLQVAPLGVDASPQRRFTAQYPPGAAPPAWLDPSVRRNFGDVDSGYDPERTPQHNLATAPSLPPRYPGATTPEPESSWPAASPAGGVAQLAIGASIGAAESDGAARPVHTPDAPTARQPASRFAAMTPIGAPAVARPSSLQAEPSSTPAASQPAPAPTPAAPPSAATEAEPRRFVPPSRRHQIRDGDTLAGLALRYYGDAARAAELFAANRATLSNPELLPIGAVLVVPPLEALTTTISSPSSAAPGQAAPAARIVPKLEIPAFGAPPTP